MFSDSESNPCSGQKNKKIHGNTDKKTKFNNITSMDIGSTQERNSKQNNGA